MSGKRNEKRPVPRDRKASQRDKIISVIYGARMEADRLTGRGLLLEEKGYETNGHWSGLPRCQKQ